MCLNCKNAGWIVVITLGSALPCCFLVLLHSCFLTPLAELACKCCSPAFACFCRGHHYDFCRRCQQGTAVQAWIECRLHRCIFLVPFLCCVKNLEIWLFVLLIVAVLVVVLVSVTAALVAVVVMVVFVGMDFAAKQLLSDRCRGLPTPPYQNLIGGLCGPQVRLHGLLQFRELCQAENK